MSGAGGIASAVARRTARAYDLVDVRGVVLRAPIAIYDTAVILKEPHKREFALDFLLQRTKSLTLVGQGVPPFQVA